MLVLLFDRGLDNHRLRIIIQLIAKHFTNRDFFIHNLRADRDAT
ncbi:Uncharacterised protein [Vibrio cholerae]|nr:Uncharacterised protein [Vibrio cholerae]CSC29665.1 Uncharacterised protein [Vibrio cholerae]